MKKVILSASALIFAAGMYGQATVTPPPAPSQAQAVTNNSGNPSANVGESVQNGNAQKVQVQQAGTNQKVYTMQDDGAGTGDNRAWIMQTGQVQAASGVENAAEVLQSGSSNQSWTKQEGDYNEALTRQGQNDPSSAYNRARIQQGVGQQAQNNKAAIDQDGQWNEAWTLQIYDNSEAYTKQDGDGNESYIVQDAGPNQTSGHFAEVDQTGDFNQSQIFQDGEFSNEAVTFQLGSNNGALQIQENNAGSDANNAMISQGDFFTGNIFLPIYFDLVALDGSIDDGPFNADSHDALAIQNQDGSGNNADIRQFSDAPAGGNYAEQNQLGDDNDAFIVQNLYGIPNGGDNYSRQDQHGDGNSAGISQAGLNHKAYQRQYGDNNEALSTQRGNDNLVNTYQAGNNNYAATLQHGMHNQAKVVQNGGHSYTVKQNEGQFGVGNNWANINQTGPNGNFLDISCEFPAPKNPDLSIDVPHVNIDAPCGPGGC